MRMVWKRVSSEGGGEISSAKHKEDNRVRVKVVIVV